MHFSGFRSSSFPGGLLHVCREYGLVFAAFISDLNRFESSVLGGKENAILFRGCGHGSKIGSDVTARSPQRIRGEERERIVPAVSFCY